ncbi:MAG: HEAT repeat domain-containing protein [Methanothrix sp.]
MVWTVLIAHDESEEELAEKLASPLRQAGYDVWHQGNVLVGESVTEEASKVLSLGGPVILCATVTAIGTGLPNRLISAARLDVKKRVFVMQMEKKAYVDAVTFGDKIAMYWQDNDKAIKNLLSALNHYFPLDEEKEKVQQYNDAEQRYCDLLLATCDLVNLGNLPEDRKIVQQPLALRRLYVPLSVRVEVEVGDKFKWEELEKRRLALMKGNIDIKEISRERESVSVGERLSKSQRLVVLGDPGSGKTTLTRWISTAYLLRRKGDPAWKDLPDVKTLPDFDLFPIVIRCRDLKENCLDGSLDDILRHTFRKAELTFAEAGALQIVLRKRLCQGTALLIIDGLDEIADPSIRSRFCQQLENIHIAYPKAPIIITSRIVGYREMGYRLGRGFEHVMIADFTPKEKDDFAGRWCELTELPENKANATEDLIHDIHSSDRIERMTGNPMLLTTLALVRRKVGKLPSRRAELYWEAVQVLLNWRSDVDKPIDTNEAIPQLGYVAYDMCDHGVQQIRRDTILELITRMRNEYPNLHQTRNSTPEVFLSRLEARTGLIIEAGHTHDLGKDIPLYEFRHLTFQEYLAARALVDGCFPGRDVKRSLANYVAPLAGCVTIEEPLTKKGIKDVAVVENWREALRLCSAICRNDEVDGVLLAILTPLEGETDGTSRARSILATLCLADEPNVSETTVHHVFQTFARNIEKDDGGGRIITGADRAASEVAGTRWASYLSTALAGEYCRRKDIDRYQVGSLCGLVCTSNAQIIWASLEEWIQHLTRNLLNGNEQQVIESALALMRLTYEKNVSISPNLTDALLLKMDGSEPQAQASAWALAWLVCKIRTPDISLQPSLDLPWKKPVWIKFNLKFDKTSWKPTSREVQYISSIIGNSHTNQEVLRLILWIIEYKWNFFKSGSLLALLDHPSTIVRSNFIEALETIASEEAIDLLLSRLDDSDANVRKSAAFTLGAILCERAVEPLILRLDDSDTNVRRAAAFALCNINNERAIDPLISKLDDSDADVRGAVTFALGEIKNERAIDPLISKLDDLDAHVRGASASALGEIKNERAIDPLISKLDDSDAHVRGAAASALGEIKNERAIDPLISKLDDSDAHVRQAAASALGEIKNERAIELFISRLDGSDADVRQAAASALGTIKNERAIDPLISKLDDSDADVRQAAASALGTTKNERAIDPLISKLDDSDAYVRQAAVSALGTIKNERAIDPLISKLDDSDADVRQAAASALCAIKKNESPIDQFILKLRVFLLRNLYENAEYGRHFSFDLKDKAT